MDEVQVTSRDVLAWLKLHGLENVPYGTAVRIILPKDPADGAYIEAQRYLTRCDGRRFIDQATGVAAVEHVTVPLVCMPVVAAPA